MKAVGEKEVDRRAEEDWHVLFLPRCGEKEPWNNNKRGADAREQGQQHHTAEQDQSSNSNNSKLNKDMIV